MSRSDHEDVAVFFGIAYGYWLLILLTVGIISGGLWLLRPVILGQEHKQNVASHQFVEAQITKIQNNANEYHRLVVDLLKEKDPTVKQGLVNQLKAIKTQIRDAAERIPVEDVPEGARTILNPAEVGGAS